MALIGCGGDGTPNNGDGDITVTFNLGGAPGTPPSDITIKNNTSLGGKYPIPTWTGHEFLVWYNGAAEYTRTTVIKSDSSTFPLTAKWKEESDEVEYAQPPAVHPGNHIAEVVKDGKLTVKVNENFEVSGLNAQIGVGDGVLTAEWYRTTTEAEVKAATTAVPTGKLIVTQEAPANSPHNMSIKFSWKEEAAGTYYYYFIVTNFNKNATKEKYNKLISQNYLTVTVTD